MDYRCMKCGSEEYKIKNVILPEKNDKLIGFETGLYYFKTCLKCGYVEIYSAKILDKNEEYSFEY